RGFDSRHPLQTKQQVKPTKRFDLFSFINLMRNGDAQIMRNIGVFAPSGLAPEWTGAFSTSRLWKTARAVPPD
ncbi:MAG TPA: hypothetical protein IAA22_06655, partial [Candidatus Olsenella stercoravium]|nr:hypothetical protein [Candidatus Olsenella stercoravium]